MQNTRNHYYNPNTSVLISGKFPFSNPNNITFNSLIEFDYKFPELILDFIENGGMICLNFLENLQRENLVNAIETNDKRCLHKLIPVF